MHGAKPSRTALRVAAHRAAHQILESGGIFADPLALRILGDHPPESQDPRMRLWVAARSRFAEDALAAAVERGARQLVVLGAGLDTFAYRNPFADLRVFEVDHPATQAWKRELLGRAGIAEPDSLVYAAIDFHRDSLAGALASAGFEAEQQTFFTWLGVVPYLEKPAIWSTLEFIGALRGGAHVVCDYPDPPEALTPETRVYHEKITARVAALGEPWLSFFDPAELHAKLVQLRFAEIEDLGPRQIAARFFPARIAATPERGGHLLRATNMTK
ncbi:MAG TPA: SAM-dependent methyltransferase [Bryobacteraceae bacterium]|nr:SAM-dependent methyltransferase [Bryobacteraceae bacterium]